MGKFNSQDLTLLRAGTGRLAKLLDIDLADVTLVPDGSAYSTVETDRYEIGLGMEATTYYLSDEERTEESSSSAGLGASNHYVKEYTFDIAGAFANMTQLQRIVLPTIHPWYFMTIKSTEIQMSEKKRSAPS
ncbi:hypothetical protein [Prevotellamassilia timonensis]|uniref:hypothetical protein n=1 Tax=Prevotellamassilia timonensis TaxID=1852370 RepID=UPI003079F209